MTIVIATALPTEDLWIGIFVKVFLFLILFLSIFIVTTLEEVYEGYKLTIRKQSEEIEYLKKLLLDKGGDKR